MLPSRNQCRSDPQRPTPPTATSTSPGCGSGSGSSCRRSSPAACSRSALTPVDRSRPKPRAYARSAFRAAPSGSARAQPTGQGQRAVRARRNNLQRDRILNCVVCRGAPGERAVGGDENRRQAQRLAPESREGLDDHLPRLAFVLPVDLAGRERACHRNGAVEVICMRRAEVRDARDPPGPTPWRMGNGCGRSRRGQARRGTTRHASACPEEGRLSPSMTAPVTRSTTAMSAGSAARRKRRWA